MTTKTTMVLGGTGKKGRRAVKWLPERGLPVRIALPSDEQRFDMEGPCHGNK